MEIKEKIKKIYQKNKVSVDDDYIECKMKDKEKVKQFTRLYKNEEIDSMNTIFEKDYTNKYFTQEELEFASKMDLFDPYMIKVAKMIWKQKDNPQMLNNFLIIAKKELTEDDIKLIKNLQEREVIA